MIPEALKESEHRLRQAIERRQYRELPGLFEDTRRIALEHRRPETAAEISEWMIVTIGWARLMVTAQRQMWADESERLPLVNRYLEPGTAPPAGLCLDL
jgi:hypothetical protein